jgi:hypothetical protein
MKKLYKILANKLNQGNAVLTVYSYPFIDVKDLAEALEVPSVLVIQWVPMDQYEPVSKDPLDVFSR